MTAEAATELSRLLARTPAMSGHTVSAVALSPLAPLVAEYWSTEDQGRNGLRITDYRSAATQVLDCPAGVRRMAFSSDGRHLAVLAGQSNGPDTVLLFSAPWHAEPVVRQLGRVFDVTWLTVGNLLVVGHHAVPSTPDQPAKECLYVGRLAPSGQWDTPGPGPDVSWDQNARVTASASPSGAVVVAVGKPSWIHNDVRTDEGSPGNTERPADQDIDSILKRLESQELQLGQRPEIRVFHPLSPQGQAGDDVPLEGPGHERWTDTAIAIDDHGTRIAHTYDRSPASIRLYDLEAPLSAVDLDFTGFGVRPRSCWPPVLKHGALVVHAWVEPGRHRDSRSCVWVFRTGPGAVQPWCLVTLAGNDPSYPGGAGSFDLAPEPDGIVVAVARKDHTALYEVPDFDLLGLGSRDAETRIRSAGACGQRRFRPAVPLLGRLLRDAEPAVSAASARALASIQDPDALPSLLSALGTPSDPGHTGVSAKDLPSTWNVCRPVLEAFTAFQAAILAEAARDGLSSPAPMRRRGAVRLLALRPDLDVFDELCETLSDGQADIRGTSAVALGSRGNLRACTALMARLNDIPEVSERATDALVAILRANGFLTPQVAARLRAPLDVAGYADSLVAAGVTSSFDRTAPTAVGVMLTALADAVVESGQSTADILNAIEGLTAPRAGTAGLGPALVAVALAMIIGEALRNRRRWIPAANVYQRAATLAEIVEAPQMSWRALRAAGACQEAVGDDRGAAAAFDRAMGVVDRLWFALLEEDKLRHFFQDKADLYDQAALCHVRLGHLSTALECFEKAKTRYLGDLIARRHLGYQQQLTPDQSSIWRVLAQARAVRLSKARTGSADSELIELVAVEVADSPEPEPEDPAEQPRMAPRWLTTFREGTRQSSTLAEFQNMVETMWVEALSVAATPDDGDHEMLVEQFAAISAVLVAVRDAARHDELPLRHAELTALVQQYRQATSALRYERVGSEALALPHRRVWAFEEWGTSWIEAIAQVPAAPEPTLVLEAVVEAVNVVVRHEPVLMAVLDDGEPECGQSSGSSTDQAELGRRFRFVTRVAESDTGLRSLNDTTTVVESLLERDAQTRWRYQVRLLRGTIAGVKEATDMLAGRPDTALIQLAITEHGTLTFVAYGHETLLGAGPLPRAAGWRPLDLFTSSELTTRTLGQRLCDGEGSWFGRYRTIRDQETFDQWLDTMDDLLQWLHATLFAPLRPTLQRAGVRRLHIIPHRGLHLIPFAALYERRPDGSKHYVVDDFTIFSSPSITLAQICHERGERRPAQRITLTSLANPTHDLPFASLEAAGIAALVPRRRRRVFHGTDARLSRVRSRMPGEILHIAGHAGYDWQDPMQSAIAFTDSALTLAELFGENSEEPGPDFGFATLSGCETGTTDPKDLSDEYLGLASGFLFSGVPTVVSGLWRLHEFATCILMARFYENMAAGMVPSAALATAQRWLRDDVTRPATIRMIDKATRALSGRVPPSVAGRIRVALRKKRAELVDDEARWPDERPFEHPCYWASVTVVGIDAKPRSALFKRRKRARVRRTQ